MPTERFHLDGAEILVGADVDEALRIAAGQFAALARKIASQGGSVHAALSGGNTPRGLFQLLAAEPFAGLVPWQDIHFFWADERNVPPGNPDSNYGIARQLLLSRVPVPPANIHRIPTGDGTAIEAADLYQRTLRETLPVANGLPRLDYALLGLGANGHTASLFPAPPKLARAPAPGGGRPCRRGQLLASHADRAAPQQRRSTDLPCHRRGQGHGDAAGHRRASATRKPRRRNSSPPAMER